MTHPDTETASSQTAYVSWAEFLGSSYAPALALVCLAVWLHAADSLIVATMLPSIVADIGGAAYVGWTVSIYEIGSIVAGAASALMTMRYGLRAPMAIAALVFGFGCISSAVSPSMAGVLIGRALQGVGGGGLVAMSFIAIGALFPRRYGARALAVLSGFWGMSAFLGPLIGGFFVEYADWRLGFWFFTSQAFALALWIALRKDTAMPGTAAELSRFPVTRLALLCLAILLVSIGGVKVDAARTTLFVLAGFGCLGWFLWRDAGAGADRLLPRAPFNLRHATGATLTMLLLLSMATVAIVAYGPLLMTVVHEMSALTAGYIVACSSIGWTLAAILVSGAAERFDRAWIIGGMALTTISIAGFAYAIPQGPIWLIALCALAEGGGFGLAWTFIMRRVTALVPADEVQRVSGAIPTVQRTGYALGAAYVAIVANASGFLTMQTPQQGADVARMIFLSCLPLAGAGLLAMIGLVRHHPYDETLQIKSPAAPS